MSNIAAYQEGFTEGFAAGKKKTKEKILSMLKAFYNDNYEPREIAERSEFIKGSTDTHGSVALLHPTEQYNLKELKQTHNHVSLLKSSDKHLFHWS